ncbi:hypothetical protein L6164_013112 [Bauhinia variegata]|uniref:Uncharacterized protein n=1 Tax=Bauhinia variegata TaxID=167791 RepID=A0ACB9PDJ1_BAUVA|nr:hypothetical protein L6164_013112 [Bauhinia variegata]
MEREESENENLVNHVALMLENAWLPEESCANERCIYRVRRPKFRQQNEAASIPRIVSIGPFHHGQKRLETMQELKLGYLKSFLEGSDLALEYCISKLKEWETNIRRCYAESIQLSSDEFVMMILIDAGFIIEHFLRYDDLENWGKRDPLFLKPWMAEDVLHDLILIENQIPFFVLKRIFKLASAKGDTGSLPSFLHITFKYFSRFNKQDLRPDGVKMQHFTDLLRTFCLPPSERLPKREINRVNYLRTTSELMEAGLVFESSPNKCLLELEFQKGVLRMPCFEVADITEVLMGNIAAFEQAHYPTETYIVDYLKFLGFLINTEKDVDALVGKGIIAILFGDSNEVATMVSLLSSNHNQQYINSDYLHVYDHLNKFYENPIHKYKANLIRDYFSTPRKTTISIAVVVLLLLIFVQSICSVLSVL